MIRFLVNYESGQNNRMAAIRMCKCETSEVSTGCPDIYWIFHSHRCTEPHSQKGIIPMSYRMHSFSRHEVFHPTHQQLDSNLSHLLKYYSFILQRENHTMQR